MVESRFIWTAYVAFWDAANVEILFTLANNLLSNLSAWYSNGDIDVWRCTVHFYTKRIYQHFVQNSVFHKFVNVLQLERCCPYVSHLDIDRSGNRKDKENILQLFICKAFVRCADCQQTIGVVNVSRHQAIRPSADYCGDSIARTQWIIFDLGPVTLERAQASQLLLACHSSFDDVELCWAAVWFHDASSFLYLSVLSARTLWSFKPVHNQASVQFLFQLFAASKRVSKIEKQLLFAFVQYL